ncbi:hypothetical protein RND81_12G033000 [Saponaria officinalis]|uniref:Rad60/SUMO-like domain-containing protein n=1 Tax=Saponaria officinalis TaxID=3572 RepID=A0AAW1H5L0_SAPOF
MAENGEISSGNSEGSKLKQKTNTTSEDDNDPRFVFIKFVDQRGKVLHLRVKRSSQFGVAFETYRKNNNLEGCPNFMYNGSRLSPSVTPAELNFRNGEQIDVFIISYGG